MARLRDKYWIWGHPENCFLGQYNNDRVCRMTPAEGALYLGARNMYMVPMDLEVNWRQYDLSLTTMDHVGWMMDINPDKVEKLIEEAKEFPNIDRAVFDDFFTKKILMKQNDDRDVRVAEVEALRDRLHTNEVRPLEMWMVLYTRDFVNKKEEEVVPYLKPFDGIILWTWEERDLKDFEKNYKWFLDHTEGQKRMLGLYLYDFGGKKPSDPEWVKWELDRYHELLLAGEVEGIVLHTNALADCGYEAFPIAHEWMKKHGDEIIPD